MKERRKRDRKRMTTKIWILAALIEIMPLYVMISNAESGWSVRDEMVLGEGSFDRDKKTDPKEQETGSDGEVEDSDDTSDVDMRNGEDTADKEQEESKDDGQSGGTGENTGDSQENKEQDANLDDGGMDLDEDANGGNTMPDAVPDKKDVPPTADTDRGDGILDADKEDTPTDPTDEALSNGSKAPILEEERSPEEELVKEEDQIKDLPVIIAFDELDIREYRFSEKPELEMLLEKFPKWLDAVAQKGYTDPEQEEDAPPDLEESQDEDKTSHKKVPTVKVPVGWGYDGVYDEDEKDEYVFFAVLDEEDYVLQTEEIPSILVKVTRADQTILTDQIGDITVTVTADADVLSGDMTLQVEQIVDKEQLTDIERTIGEEAQTMIGMRMRLYDGAGKAFHPDLEKKAIHICFEGLDGALGANPEEVELYSFGGVAEAVIKEDAERNGDSIRCLVSHLDGIVGCVMAERGGTVVEICRDGEVVHPCTSLAQAVGWAEDGDTLLLTADHIVEKEETPIIIRQEITLDLNGYTLTLERVMATNRNITITGPDQEPGMILAVNNRGILHYKKEDMTQEDVDEDAEGASVVESGLIIGHCAAWGSEG